MIRQPKVIDYYRDKLKKYGKVLECHSQKHGGDVEVNDSDKDSKDSKELKCEDNSGPVTELKVGTEDNQHVVAIEPRDASKGSTFALVYVHTRGSAEISRQLSAVHRQPEIRDQTSKEQRGFASLPLRAILSGKALLVLRWNSPVTNAGKRWKKESLFARTVRRRRFGW